MQPKLRSELSPAITSTATHQTCLMFSTTLLAVIGAALTPAIAAGSMYRCARIPKLSPSLSWGPCWKRFVRREVWHTYRKYTVKHPWHYSCRGLVVPRVAIATYWAGFCSVHCVREEYYAHCFPRQSRTGLSQRPPGTYAPCIRWS